ncbi:MAG: GNAT family N-acetyltransferase [Chloroflexi bacterium]|nr:GNAT family N-acetyltransferase [Chloroflexota bacterium]
MATTNIHIRRISEREEFRKLKDSWDALLAQNHRQSSFITWEWLFSWWEIYGQKDQLWLVTAWQDEELVGIIPLARNKERIKGINFRTLESLGSPQRDVSAILVKNMDEKIITAMAEYLLAQKKQWDTVVLAYYTQNDPVLNALRLAFQKAGYEGVDKFSEQFYLPLAGDWPSFHATLSRNFRKNLRRATSSAKKKGIVSLKHYKGKAANWPIFEKIVALNQYGNFPIIYNSQKEQEFHKKLLEVMQEKAIFDIFLLYIDDKLVAYEYGFTYGQRYESWRAGYDTRYDPKVSSGKLLAQLSIEKSFELGYQEVDFLRGDEPYKLGWRPSARKYTKIRFIKKNNYLALFIFIYLAKIKSWLKKYLHKA